MYGWGRQPENDWSFSRFQDQPDPMSALIEGLTSIAGKVEVDQAKEPWWLVTSAVPVITAVWWRRHQQLEPIPPDPTLPHSADFLNMLLDSPPDDAQVQALDSYWAGVSDHGLNASTFTARVIASTGSDLPAAISGAAAALKGPLHGGAPGPVLDMLDAIGSPEHAETWIRGELAQGRRIMGMGHRVYRVRDPRAAAFEAAVSHIASRSQTVNDRLALARAVEREAEAIFREQKPQRPIRANVEFYTAVLLEALGVPRELFTNVFAAGRVVGWCAHIGEQWQTGRLIRPKSRYRSRQTPCFAAPVSS